MSHAGVGWAVGPVPLSQSTSAGDKGPLGISGKDLGGPGATGCEREVVFLNGWDILGKDAARLEQRQCRMQVHSSAGASSHHHLKGRLGPAAFSQIQKCRSLGPVHWVGLILPRLIMAQVPFDFDCHGLS